MNPKLLGKIRKWVASGRSGAELKERYTREIDTLLRRIFNSAGKDARTVLIATGGYGRGELAPFSDIDIMCFAPEIIEPEAIETVLYRLWDTGLEISHSCRNGNDCIEEAFKDIRTRTSLLEARYIAGDRAFFDYFKRNVYPEILHKNRREFVSEKLREMESRHLSSGHSVFLLEPNIKEGEGGLRDIHTAWWLSKVVFRSGDFKQFLDMLDPYERKRFAAAYDFLIRTRFSLHLESGRKNDLLSFEFQKKVADLLGFRDSPRFKGSERMMRYYYLKSRVVKEITLSVINKCSKMYVPVRKDFVVRRITPEFSVSGGNLVVTGEDLFVKRPEKIIEGFYLSAKTGKKFSPVAREKIRTSLPRINKKIRSSREAVTNFLRILKGGNVYDTLHDMHETGVLGRFIPEFGALRLLVIHEPYHMYTVDEHTLIAIRNLEELKKSTYGSRRDLHEIMSRIPRPDILYLALLLHDIGKGAGRHHEEEGYKRLKYVLERFNFDAEKRMRIEFLVKNHILMSTIALKREASDPEVAAMLADAVLDIENLDAIYLITYADMSAVNPKFWTSWKAYLLRELYDRTRDYLSGIKAEPGEYLMSLTETSEKEDLSRFVESMPRRYFLSTTRAKVLEDYALTRQLREKGLSLRIDRASDGLVEISVSAFDSPGLFSKIVGVFSSRGLNIVNGRIFTGMNGIVIDKISISNWKEVFWAGLVDDLENGLRNVVLEGGSVPVSGRTSGTGTPFDIFIELDNEASEEFSLVEVFSPDRLGLLYDVSDAMYRKGIDITSARINTETGLAQDIFYVRVDKKKLDGEIAQELLSELWTVLKGNA